MPVDLSLTPDQELIRNTARDYIEKQVPLPKVKEIDDSETGFSPEVWKQAVELGWTGICVPQEYGGIGGSLTDTAVLYEEMGRGALHTPHHSSCVLCAQIILGGGSDAQKKDLLEGIVSGKRIVALAYTEDNYGWEPQGIETNARQAGEDFVLSGVKSYIPDANIATDLIVAAKTGSGLTLFLVDPKSKGISLQILHGFVGERLSRLTFDNVRVSKSSVIGAVGKGWQVLEPAFDNATAVLSAYMVGAGQKAFEIAMGYTQRRVQFGRPVAKFERVQDHLIDGLAAVDGARWSAYEAVWALENNKKHAREAVSVAKAAASDAFYFVCEESHHCHGGIGCDRRYGLYLYTKKSRSLYHYLGDPAHHRKRLADLLF